MGLFDDIADVYTGAKQAKDVAPSSQLVIRNNQSVRQAIESNREQRERNEDRGYTPPTQDQQVAQQIEQQQQKQREEKKEETKTDTSSGIIQQFEKKTGLKLPELNLTFGKPIKQLSPLDLQKILDEVKKYQAGMPNYFEGIPGGLNFAKGFADSISQGTERSGEFGGVKGSPTLQGLTEFIRGLDPDSNMLDSFKEADPATYLDVFGLPATDAGLDFFAGLDIGQADKETSQLIMEARKRLQDSQSRQDANMGQGIMAASPALTGISVPAGGTISPTAGGIVSNPVLSPVAVGNMTPTTATGITPFNINQFYASLPQYTQQGIMAPTNFSRFTDALRMFPGAIV